MATERPRNKQVRITRPKHKLTGWVDGTRYVLHVRSYRDRRGKRRLLVCGPGLKDAKDA